jgi:RNA polymerase primary sigma factor
VAARHKIIEAYMKLVLMIVGKYYLGGEKDDLMQVGNLALIDAVDRFDYNNGAKFSGFVSPYIHGRIKRYLEEDTTVKRPGSLWEDQRMLKKNQNEFIEKHGRDPTYDELYKLTATKWKEKRGWKMSENYFNQLLEAKKPNAVDDIILDQIRRNEINQDAMVDTNRILSILDPREQVVIRNLHGIGGGKLLSIVGLAKQFGVTKARIYQIQAAALKKMKNFLAKDTNLALGTGE